MPPLLDTASLITDAEVFNASSSQASERVKLLQYAQDVEAEILALRRWWFLTVQRTFSFLSGVQEVNIADDIANVLNISDFNGLQLGEADGRTWRNVFQKSITTGRPEFWNEQPRNDASQILVVSLWPIPSTTENGKFEGRLHAVALADNNANYSRIPEEYRAILSIGMHEKMALDEEKVQLQQGLLTRRDNLVSAMVAEDTGRGAGSR